MATRNRSQAKGSPGKKWGFRLNLITATRLSLWDKPGVCFRCTTKCLTKTKVGIFSLSTRGDTVVAASDRIEVCNSETGAVTRTLSGHDGHVLSVNVNPQDHNVVVSGGSDDKIKLWDIKKGKVKKTFYDDSPVRCVRYNNDAMLVASCSDDTIRVWDVESTRRSQDCVRKLVYGQGIVSSSLDFFPHDRNQIVSGMHDRSIQVWDLRAAEVAVSFLNAHDDTVNSVRLAPQGFLLMSGGGDGTFKFWDMRKGKCITSVDAHSKGVRCVRFCRSTGSVAVTASIDGTAKVWVLQPKVRCVATAKHTSGVFSAELSEDGKSVMTGSADGSVKIWSVEIGNSDGIVLTGLSNTEKKKARAKLKRETMTLLNKRNGK